MRSRLRKELQALKARQTELHLEVEARDTSVERCADPCKRHIQTVACTRNNELLRCKRLIAATGLRIGELHFAGRRSISRAAAWVCQSVYEASSSRLKHRRRCGPFPWAAMP